MKPIDGGRIYDAIVPDGNALIVRVWEAGVSTKPIGSALIFVHDDYVEVLHIYVEKPFRHRGYAKDIVRELQKKYDYIITGWNGSEQCGRELFLEMGFKLCKPIKKRLLSTLEWRRK